MSKDMHFQGREMKKQVFAAIGFLAIFVAAAAGTPEAMMTVSNQNSTKCVCVQGVVGKNVQPGAAFVVNQNKSLDIPFSKLTAETAYRFVFTIVDAANCTLKDCPSNPDTTGSEGGALTLWYSPTKHTGYVSSADFTDADLNVEPMNDSADKIPVNKVAVTYK